MAFWSGEGGEGEEQRRDFCLSSDEWRVRKLNQNEPKCFLTPGVVVNLDWESHDSVTLHPLGTFLFIP